MKRLLGKLDAFLASKLMTMETLFSASDLTVDQIRELHKIRKKYLNKAENNLLLKYCNLHDTVWFYYLRKADKKIYKKYLK